MPGTTPAASQLDWLISSTTTMVLFCSKAIRERLRSSTWVMGAPPSIFAQRQRCQTFAAVPIASGPISEVGSLQTSRFKRLRHLPSVEFAELQCSILMLGGGHEAARVHWASRRCGGVAARGARKKELSTPRNAK